MLLEEAVFGEVEGFAAQVAEEAGVQFLAAGAEGFVCVAEVFAAFVEGAEFLGVMLGCERAEKSGEGLLWIMC